MAGDRVQSKRYFLSFMVWVYATIPKGFWAFHGKRKNLMLDGGLQTRRSRLKLIAGF